MTTSLIDALGLSLVLAVVTGTVLRARNYRVLVGLVCDSAGRRPKLRALVATRRTIFLRGTTFSRLAATLVLTPANGCAVHFVWPHAVLPSATC